MAKAKEVSEILPSNTEVKNLLVEKMQELGLAEKLSRPA
jgi:hypothetical protein